MEQFFTQSYENRTRRLPPHPPGLTSGTLPNFWPNMPPEHEYIVDGARYDGVRPLPRLPPRVAPAAAAEGFQRDDRRQPQFSALPAPLFAARAAGAAAALPPLRSASRLITVNRDAREELSERLRIDPGRIEVVMPLAARVPHEPPAGAQLEAVRRNMLPAEFILMLGTVEERHNHKGYSRRWLSLGERERAIRAEGLRAASAPPRPAGLAGWLPDRDPGRVPPAGGGRHRRMRGEAPDGHRRASCRSSAERVGAKWSAGRRTAYSDPLVEFALRAARGLARRFSLRTQPRRPAGVFRLAHAFVYRRCRDRGVDRAVVERCVPGAHGAEHTQLNREAAGAPGTLVRLRRQGAVAGKRAVGREFPPRDESP